MNTRLFLDALRKNDDAASDALLTQVYAELRSIARAQSSEEIAVSLGISLKTVETHRNKVFRKLNAHCVADVIRYAIRRGLVDL